MSVRLASTRFGERTSRSPLLIVHGLFGNKVNWRSIAKQLAVDREVFTLDLRNHGASPHSPDMNLEQMADDLFTFAKDQSLNTFSLLGHSLGGKVCMTAALQEKQKVDSLIVADIAPVPYTNLSTFYTYVETMNNIDLSTITSKKQVEKIILTIETDPSIIMFLLSNLKRVDKKQNPGNPNTFEWRVNLPAIHNHITEIGNFELDPKIKYENPTLFIYGRKANYVRPKDHLSTITEFFPNVILKGMNTGHWVHSENPSLFLDHCQTFLKEKQI